MADNSGSWYHAAFEDLFSKRLDPAYFQVFRRHREDLHLSTAKSVLSFGVGNGNVDIYLATHCAVNARSYTGVEPQTDNCAVFLEQMKLVRPELDVSVFCGTGDEYTGPASGQVDAVILSHVLYFVDDPLKTIRRALKWLDKDGYLYIFQLCPNQVWVDIPGISMPSITYDSEDVKQDLRKLGLADEGMLQELFYEQIYDVRKPSKDTANGILNRDCNDGEFEELKVCLSQQAGDGYLRDTNSILCLPKKALNNV